MAETLEITAPDDWHLHLRDGDLLRRVLPATAARFRRAIVMPNLDPPVRTVADARAYRQRILDALPEGAAFEPLMTLYLTPETTPDEILRAKESGIVHGVKLYPKGATTNAEAGVEGLASVSTESAAAALSNACSAARTAAFESASFLGAESGGGAQ